jgi:oxaloacetate decarboxylase gamma subunit
MVVDELLMEGLRLMVIGMGIVFAFLLLLVGVLRGMSAIVLRFAHEARIAKDGEGTSTLAPKTEEMELVAVISAAVARYRRSRQGH